MSKLTRILAGCGKPSPTSDDVPSTSGGRRSRSSRPSAGPEDLSRRTSSEATVPGQRPRGTSKLVHTLKEARHSVAVAMHLSKSRSRPPQPNPDAASNQTPPGGPTMPVRGQWQPSPHASLNEASLYERAPSITLESFGSLVRGGAFDETTQPAAQDPGPTLERSSHTKLPRHSDVLPPEILNSSPVVVQPATPPTQTQPPPVRLTEGPPDPDPGSANFVAPLVHRETPQVQALPWHTRGPTPLPRQDSIRSDNSIHSDSSSDGFGTFSLGNNRHVRRDPPQPLVWHNIPLDPTPPETPPVTPPQTPRQTEPTATARPQRTDRPSRRETIATAATQALNQMHLPQAGKVLANTSLIRELGATANTLLKPLQVAAQTGSTLAQAGASWLNRRTQSSEELQQVLGNGEALGRPEFQELAHEVAVDYGKHAATVLDTALPMVHSILKIGGAGTAMAFGAGRNTGLAAGDALGRLERGAPQATGVRAGPERAAATLPSGTAFKLMGAGAQQLVLGSLTGAVGNLAGQYLAAPLVNLIPRQFAPIDLRAVLPDETVNKMNQLQPGAGDTLRQQVKEAQQDVATINSASNVRLGQIAFDAITAARFAAQGGLPLGVAGQVGIGLAVSSSAGMVIGAVMASRQSVATHAIPDLEALRLAVAAHENNPGSDGAAALAQVTSNAVPLFYPKRTVASASPQAPDIDTGPGLPVSNADTAQRGRLASMRDTAQWALQQAARPLVAVGQAWGQSLGNSPLIEPAAPGTDGAITTGRVLETASNVAASVVNRAGEMAKATLTTSLMSTGSAMLASSIDGPAREFVLAMGNAVGIHAAIKPWFDSLVTEVPQGDAKIKAHRAQVAN